MLTLHFPTVMFNMVVTCAVSSIVIAMILLRRRKNYRGLGRICGMFGMMTLGIILLFLKGTLPEFWTSLVANGLVVGGFWLGLNGIECFVDRPHLNRPSLFILLTFLGIHAYWIYIRPEINLRAINLSVAVIAFSLLSAYRLLHPTSQEMLSYTRNCAYMYLAFAGMVLLRSFHIATSRDLNADYLSSSGIEPMFFVIFQAVFIFITYFVLVMVNKRLLEDKEKALSEVRILSGMLPICASCKNVRDDQGYWKQIEEYLQTHSEAVFSHSICPDCAKNLYPELYEETRTTGETAPGTGKMPGPEAH